MDRGGLEPSEEGGTVFFRQHTALIGDKPLPRLLGDRGTNLFVAWGHRLIPTASFPSLQTTAAVTERLRQVLLHHVPRYPQPLADLLVREPVAVLENDRRTAFDGQRLQH